MKKIISINALCQLIGKSRSTIWRWQKIGILPASIKLGPNSVGFYEADILACLDSMRS